MFNNTFFSFEPLNLSLDGNRDAVGTALKAEGSCWLVFFLASFLVSVPVFFQAPLVRLYPNLSLVLTIAWVCGGLFLYRRPRSRLWGDIILGFSWSWLAGSIYWGWLRWFPSIHIPVEAIGLPFACWCIARRWGLVGNFFYLGSLLGTAITDLYFYIAGLIPYWKQVMLVEPDLFRPILQSAITVVQTPWGVSWAVVLLNVLLAVSGYSLQKKELHWWAFGGAVLSTIVVDGLFWVAASAA